MILQYLLVNQCGIELNIQNQYSVLTKTYLDGNLLIVAIVQQFINPF